MKQIIRLTESDLHRVIKESVKNILMELNYISPGIPGNTMTMGGNFGQNNTTDNVDIMETFIQKLVDNSLDDDITDAVIEKCNENPQLFNIGFDVNSAYDETTGYGTQDSPVITAQPTTGYNELKQFLKNITNNPQIAQMLVKILDEAIQEESNNLTEI